MKITRPNMADLSRTFSSSGESDSKAVPEVSIDMPPVITPVMEFCRPMMAGNASITPGTPIDESAGSGILFTVPAGGPMVSVPLVRLRRGVWRLVLDLSFATTVAVPVATNYATMGLVGIIDGVFTVGISLLNPAIGVQTGHGDYLIHLGSDTWELAIEIADPVTATAVNRVRGSWYACHLL